MGAQCHLSKEERKMAYDMLMVLMLCRYFPKLRRVDPSGE